MRGLVASIPVVLVWMGGCGPSYIGTPCTPTYEEDDPTFLGFDPGEIGIDTTSDPNVVCLAYHFRGRTTCPYGQDKTATALPAVDGASGGSFPDGIGPCVTPKGAPVTGDPLGDPYDLAQVPPQCLDRPASKVVFFSCRCANADGKTDDGADYCSCSNGTKCQPLVPPTGAGMGLTQMYCIPPGISYDPSSACLGACDPRATTCP
jgi:hypothetical protein